MHMFIYADTLRSIKIYLLEMKITVRQQYYWFLPLATLVWKLQHKGVVQRGEGGGKNNKPPQTEWSVVRKDASFWNGPLETDTRYSPASPFLRALAEHELWCVSCDFSLLSLSKCSFGNLLFWNCFISSPLVSVKWKEAHQLNGHIFITVFFPQSC